MSNSSTILSRGLLRNQEGVTAVEFAIIGPVFLLIVTGIIEFSLIMFVSNVLEAATNVSSRIGSTGYDPNGVTRQQEIVNLVDAETGGMLNTSLITINTEVYSNFNNIGQPEPCITALCHSAAAVPGVDFTDINGNGVWDADMGASGLGGAGDVVVYKVSYPWRVNTPMIAAIIGSTYTINSSAVVRNEPYTTAGGR